MAGDTLKSAADSKLPMVGVSLLYRHGHFRQNVETGEQREEPQHWNFKKRLEPVDARISLRMEGREIQVRAWRFRYSGVTGSEAPVYFLDSHIEDNDPADRDITRTLYPSDSVLRLKQEALLGIGGVRMLHELGYEPGTFHMNEGHSALLGIELLAQFDGDEEAVRNHCVFTTHTPVAAGHDKFTKDEVARVFEKTDIAPEQIEPFYHDGLLNMTFLALSLSHFVNGVSHRHSEVSTDLYPNYEIDSITNGVHPQTWTGDAFQEIFDEWLPRWRLDPFALRNFYRVPEDRLLEAHVTQKAELCEYVAEATGVELDTKALTLGFARRMTLYKRPTLLFHDIDRLRRIAEKEGNLQLIFAGKSHPADEKGKEFIEELIGRQQQSTESLKVVFLPDYDMKQARFLTGGVDVWLNTPSKPYEASGTSGMKAALNGVPHFSVCDGWWLEGGIEGVTGWSIGPAPEDAESDDPSDAADIYDKLESTILPCFHRDRAKWTEIMRHCIGINGSFFHSHRMLQQYVVDSYLQEKA